MPIYKCVKCEKEFTQKGHLRNHYNRKIPCDSPLHIIVPPINLSSNTTVLSQSIDKLVKKIEPEVINDKKCNFCNKIFSRKDVAAKHMKYNCKVAKQQNKEKNDTNEKLKLLELVIERLKLLELENNKINDKLKLVEFGYENTTKDNDNMKKDNENMKKDNENMKKDNENMKKEILQLKNQNNITNNSKVSKLSHEIINFDNSSSILIIKEDDRKIWFKAVDVANIAEYSDINEAISTYVATEDKISFKNLITTDDTYNLLYCNMLDLDTIFINESGMYFLTSHSHLPKTMQFKKWVSSELIPLVHKHGSYNISSQHECDIFRNDIVVAPFDKKKVVYIGYVGKYKGERVYKYGKTYDIYDRISSHRLVYDKFEPIYVEECLNYEVVEKQLEKELKTKKIHKKIKIGGVIRKELFMVTQQITMNVIKKILDDLIKCFPIRMDVMLGKIKYKTLKETNKQKELDIQHHDICIEYNKIKKKVK
jgi:prophage antirepressor-like protein